MIDLLEAGDVLVEKGSDLWGAGVKLLFGADHQHAALVTHDTRFIVEAVWNGVKVNHLGDRLDQYELWRPLCPEVVRHAAVDDACRSLGEGYGYQQLVLSVLSQRLRIPVPDVPGVWCGELIARSYSRQGYDLRLDLPDHTTGPWDLRNPGRLVRIV